MGGGVRAEFMNEFFLCRPGRLDHLCMQLEHGLIFSSIYSAGQYD